MFVPGGRLSSILDGIGDGYPAMDERRAIQSLVRVGSVEAAAYGASTSTSLPWSSPTVAASTFAREAIA